ncbi:MAG: SPOR domain-containing protein [Bacteroidales bacterium]|nr:SPOR domain-containing protein [Bacteroidales bacterium]
MKKSVIFLMLAVALTLSSCDFMRKMSGRPTKEELNALKGEMERIDQLRQEEIRVRACIDSLEQVRKALEESLACVDSLAEVQPEVAAQPVQPVQQVRQVVDNSRYLTANLENRYYVIIGAFQSYSNAKALYNKADKFGYSPVFIGCRNGLIGVGVCPVDDYEDALLALQMLRREKFCPANPWIYTNNR